MTVIGWIQILLYCAIVVALVKPLGWYMTRVFNGESTFLSPVLRPVERGLYWIGGVDEKREQHWLTYTVAMLLFHVGGFLIIYGLMRLQALLPFNPQDQSAVAARPFLQHRDLLPHQHQLAELRRRKHAVLSDADGRPDAPELPVGRDRHCAGGGADPRLLPFLDAHHRQFLGRCDANHPLCAAADLIVYTLFLVWQGMPQTLGAYVEATTLEGAKQTIAVGPVASQVAIKMLGTNGGGFFNANAAHPFENPTALSNFVQMLSIFALGAALTNVFGRMVGNQRQGWAILAVMGVLFMSGVAVTYWAEANGTSGLGSLGMTGGNREGKEVARHRRLLPVRGRHHRGLLRCGQRHA